MGDRKHWLYSIAEIIFMVILLTFISPYILDFGEDSIEELFQEVYVHADYQAKSDFSDFIDDTLCISQENEVQQAFTTELAIFCYAENKDEICQSPNSSGIYHDQICQIYQGSEFTEFCASVQTPKETVNLQFACAQLDDQNMTEEQFFLVYIESNLDVVKKDVFDHGSVHDSALEALSVPKVFRIEDYLLWQRLLLTVLLLGAMYYFAGNYRRLTHNMGHVFVQTGGFLIGYRLLIAILTYIFGIDTSYLFEVLILSNGTLPFSEIFAEVFFALFLLIHPIIYEPTYWLVAILFILIGFVLYIPWVRQQLAKRKTQKQKK